MYTYIYQDQISYKNITYTYTKISCTFETTRNCEGKMKNTKHINSM